MFRKKSTRVLAIGDFHCGHEVGLTPPGWNPQYERPELQKGSDYRSYMWDRFSSVIRSYGPFDVCIANGDLIDGRGEKIGGTEEIFVDRDKQILMATEVLETVKAKEYYITRGTDYHVGPYENFEDTIAKNIGARAIGDVLKIDVGGLMFNAKHHIGGSQSPQGRATALLREDTWDALWAIKKDFVRADVILRSHVHYFLAVTMPDMLIMTLPGLQGYGTRFGERRMSGIIDFGVVVFDVAGKDNFTWKPILFPFPTPAPYVAGQR